MNNKTIGVFVEISKDIGMGHFYRSLNFIKNIKYNFNYLYYIENIDIDQIIYSKIKDTNIILKKLNSIDKLLDEVNTLSFNIFLIDSFKNNYNIEILIKEKVKNLIIWDHYPYTNHNCHLILDHTIINLEDKHKENINKDCKILNGLNNIIFNETIYNYNKIKPRENLKVITILMGGTDVNNLTLRILNQLELLNSFNYKLNVITTKIYTDYDKINSYCKNKNIKIYNNINNDMVIDVFSNTDLLINSAGMTNFEALFFGIPVISFFVNNTQENHFFNFLNECIFFKCNKMEELNYILENIMKEYNNISSNLFKLIPKEKIHLENTVLFLHLSNN